jgi:single-strand DNA-binding protein|tara:strand:+ start:1430 stop:1867 length:438 start_codon:yes stop_codon:yes gene_type:complete
MLNKVTLIGRLGKDVELRQTQNGDSIANLSLATSKKWKDKKSGESQEKTEWHRIAMFGKLADIANNYLNKGSLVYIEGELQTRKWQDKDGNDKYSTEVVCAGFTGNMTMLDGPKKDIDRGGQNQPQGSDNQTVDTDPGVDDDVPF